MLQSHCSARGLAAALLLPSTLALVSCGALKRTGDQRKAEDLNAVKAQPPAKWQALKDVPQGNATAWLADFDSPTLRRLVEQAVSRNHDLRATAAAVREAHAQVRAAGADLRPQASADLAASRSQQPSGKRFAGVGQRFNRFETGLNLSWELDVWGRIRDQREAAVAVAEAQAEDYQAARLSLAATVAKTALSLAEAQAARDIAAEDVQARKTQLEVLNKQLDRGLNAERGALDLSLSRADLARSEATLEQRKREADGLRRALQTLLGGYPSGSEQGLGTSLPSVHRSVPVGLPSELLLRRPDLRAAERRMEAAVREEAAAKKAFLPSIKLTNNDGFSTQQLADLLTHDSLAWSIAGSLAQNLTSGGRLKANKEAARARYDQALERYAQAALEAFTDVETALAAERFWLAQEAALERAASEAERAEELARSSYERGLADVLTLLDSRARAFTARSSLLSARASRLRNRVDLYLALGGGF